MKHLAILILLTTSLPTLAQEETAIEVLESTVTIQSEQIATKTPDPVSALEDLVVMLQTVKSCGENSGIQDPPPSFVGPVADSPAPEVKLTPPVVTEGVSVQGEKDNGGVATVQPEDTDVQSNQD